VAGLSENIRVRSIVGRFLEHSRIFHFHAGGADIVYCGSADWMSRNFFGRVEVAFPIDDPKLKQRVLSEGITAYLEDNSQAWELEAGGSYRRLAAPDQKAQRAQEYLLGQMASPAA
jgi:polyphosphate kinase